MSRMAAALVTLLVVGCRLPAPFPSMPGWREPTWEESNQPWRDADSRRYLRADGDFNGDGKMDSARLLVRNDGSKLV